MTLDYLFQVSSLFSSLCFHARGNNPGLVHTVSVNEPRKNVRLKSRHFEFPSPIEQCSEGKLAPGFNKPWREGNVMGSSSTARPK